MTVVDVQNLKLQDGINCLDVYQWLKHQRTTELPTTVSESNDDSFAKPTSYQKLAPVSKCLLVGTIVYANRRRDGSMVYVLDDGTGLMDCVHWTTLDSQDIYYLPQLDKSSGDTDEKFSVGEQVRVFGKIDCLAVTSGDGEGKELIIREIQASIIERVTDIASEARHWKKCITDAPKSIQAWLDTLGHDIQTQVKQMANLPAADDSAGLWRVFGASCRCKLDYKESLLYCHCQSTLEPLDPSLRFRDALLGLLLKMQEKTTKKLLFRYREMRTNPQLQTVASREWKGEGGTMATFIEKLFLSTFRALRKDGIVHLMNTSTDEYLLITREKVLEPFIRGEMENNDISTARNFVRMSAAPKYISRVHTERLLLINRLLWDEYKK